MQSLAFNLLTTFGHLQRLLLATCWLLGGLGLTGVKAKPLVSFGLSHRTYQSPYAESYYSEGGYQPYHPGSLYPEYPPAYPAAVYPSYPPAYPYLHPGTPYAPGNRYGALDIGIGALSLTPFLL